MNKHNLLEKTNHGMPAFPVEFYNQHFKANSNIIAPLHFHKEFEFCIVVEGEMIFRINEKNIILRKGNGVFVNSEYLHSILPAGNNKSAFIAMLFDAKMICTKTDAIYNKYIFPLINGNISLSEKLTNEEFELILSTEKIYNEKTLGYELKVKSNILKIFSIRFNTAKTITAQVSGKKREIIKLTLDYIHNHYTNPITLAELAAYVYVSPEYLCRIFSEMSDVSPIEYLNRYRIMCAADMLLEDNKSISEILSHSGFNSHSYFNKLFMRYVNTTPTEYRKNNSNWVKNGIM